MLTSVQIILVFLVVSGTKGSSAEDVVAAKRDTTMGNVQAIYNRFTRTSHGKATYYGDYPGGGACALDPLPPLVNQPGWIRIAVGQDDYQGSLGCGMCVEIRGTGKAAAPDLQGTTPVQGVLKGVVHDLCGSCQQGDADLYIPGNGKWKIQMKAIDCPTILGPAGYIQLRFTGSNEYYFKLQARNAKIPVAGMEVFNTVTGDWYCLKRTDDNYFASEGLGRITIPMKLRLTGITNEQLETVVTSLKNDESFPTDVQFSGIKLRGGAPDGIKCFGQGNRAAGEATPADDEKFCAGRSDGIYADPKDCSAFYECSNGRSFKKFCPNGLKFNALIKNCDDPLNVNCAKHHRYTKGDGKKMEEDVEYEHPSDLTGNKRSAKGIIQNKKPRQKRSLPIHGKARGEHHVKRNVISHFARHRHHYHSHKRSHLHRAHHAANRKIVKTRRHRKHQAEVPHTRTIKDRSSRYHKSKETADKRVNVKVRVHFKGHNLRGNFESKDINGRNEDVTVSTLEGPEQDDDVIQTNLSGSSAVNGKIMQALINKGLSAPAQQDVTGLVSSMDDPIIYGADGVYGKMIVKGHKGSGPFNEGPIQSPNVQQHERISDAAENKVSGSLVVEANTLEDGTVHTTTTITPNKVNQRAEEVEREGDNKEVKGSSLPLSTSPANKQRFSFLDHSSQTASNFGTVGDLLNGIKSGAISLNGGTPTKNDANGTDQSEQNTLPQQIPITTGQGIEKLLNNPKLVDNQVSQTSTANPQEQSSANTPILILIEGINKDDQRNSSENSAKVPHVPTISDSKAILSEEGNNSLLTKENSKQASQAQVPDASNTNVANVSGPAKVDAHGTGTMPSNLQQATDKPKHTDKVIVANSSMQSPDANNQSVLRPSSGAKVATSPSYNGPAKVDVHGTGTMPSNLQQATDKPKHTDKVIVSNSSMQSPDANNQSVLQASSGDKVASSSSYNETQITKELQNQPEKLKTPGNNMTGSQSTSVHATAEPNSTNAKQVDSSVNTLLPHAKGEHIEQPSNISQKEGQTHAKGEHVEKPSNTFQKEGQMMHQQTPPNGAVEELKNAEITLVGVGNRLPDKIQTNETNGPKAASNKERSDKMGPLSQSVNTSEGHSTPSGNSTDMSSQSQVPEGVIVNKTKPGADSSGASTNASKVPNADIHNPVIAQGTPNKSAEQQSLPATEQQKNGIKDLQGPSTSVAASGTSDAQTQLPQNTSNTIINSNHSSQLSSLLANSVPVRPKIPVRKGSGMSNVNVGEAESPLQSQETPGSSESSGTERGGSSAVQPVMRIRLRASTHGLSTFHSTASLKTAKKHHVNSGSKLGDQNLHSKEANYPRTLARQLSDQVKYEEGDTLPMTGSDAFDNYGNVKSASPTISEGEANNLLENDNSFIDNMAVKNELFNPSFGDEFHKDKAKPLEGTSNRIPKVTQDGEQEGKVKNSNSNNGVHVGVPEAVHESIQGQGHVPDASKEMQHLQGHHGGSLKHPAVNTKAHAVSNYMGNGGYMGNSMAGGMGNGYNDDYMDGMSDMTMGGANGMPMGMQSMGMRPTGMQPTRMRQMGMMNGMGNMKGMQGNMGMPQMNVNAMNTNGMQGNTGTQQMSLNPMDMVMNNPIIRKKMMEMQMKALKEAQEGMQEVTIDDGSAGQQQGHNKGNQAGAAGTQEKQQDLQTGSGELEKHPNLSSPSQVLGGNNKEVSGGEGSSSKQTSGGEAGDHKKPANEGKTSSASKQDDSHTPKTTNRLATDSPIPQNFCHSKTSGVYADIKNPSKFFICYNGVTEERQCSKGLVFNPREKICELPDQRKTKDAAIKDTKQTDATKLRKQKVKEFFKIAKRQKPHAKKAIE